MSDTLILGYGNPLRGDDALGWMVAAELELRFADDESVDVVAVHQLTLDLAERLCRYRRVVLVDAYHNCAPALLLTERVRSDERIPGPFSHYVTPGQLLAATATLYGSSPDVVFVGLGAAGFEAGAPVSPAVRAVLPRLIDVIVEQVTSVDPPIASPVPRSWRRAQGWSR